MIASLIYLLIVLLVIGVIWYATTLIPLPAPIPKLIQIVVIVVALIIVVVFLLQIAGHIPGVKLP